MKAFIAFFMGKNLVVLAPNKLIILSLPSLSFSMSPKKFWGNSSKNDWIDNVQLDEIKAFGDEIGKMLSSLINSIKNSMS